MSMRKSRKASSSVDCESGKRTGKRGGRGEDKKGERKREEGIRDRGEKGREEGKRE